MFLAHNNFQLASNIISKNSKNIFYFKNENSKLKIMHSGKILTKFSINQTESNFKTKTILEKKRSKQLFENGLN